MSIEESSEGVQRHLGIAAHQVGKYVLLPGDPGRCAAIAAHFDDAALVHVQREFETWTGRLAGEPVSVVSTGVGSPSAAIAIEELIKLGAHTFIRVGTSGAIQPDTRQGELAIVSGAIRDEGTTPNYLPIEFPAIADGSIVAALRDAAQEQGAAYRIGVSHSKDSFYGEVEPDRMPLAPLLRTRWDSWKSGGAICSEMEASALFIIAAIHRVRAGGVMQMNVGGAKGDQTVLLTTAVRALELLIERDQTCN